MGIIQHLQSGEAISKLKELAESIDICMFVTHAEGGNLHARPMSTQQVDDQGKIWFMSSKDSNKNHEIQEGSHVHLYYAERNSNHYLAIKGSVTITQDKAKIDELWDGVEKAWFSGGKDDPNLTLLCVTPVEGHYRDTVHGSMVALIKMGISAITGKQMEDGVEGNLSV